MIWKLELLDLGWIVGEGMDLGVIEGNERLLKSERDFDFDFDFDIDIDWKEGMEGDSDSWIAIELRGYGVRGI